MERSANKEEPLRKITKCNGIATDEKTSIHGTYLKGESMDIKCGNQKHDKRRRKRPTLANKIHLRNGTGLVE